MVEVYIPYLTRIEGHGNIVVKEKEGKIECRWEIPEAPRFYEAMLRGKPWDKVAHITSRICGICSAGHTLASIKATEDAFGIKPSEQTWLLRILLNYGEYIQSHSLHAFFLALPDFVGAPSVIHLIPSHKEAVLAAVRLKKLGNDIADLIGGRAVHPCSAFVGGFGRIPTENELLALKAKLQKGQQDIHIMVDVFASLRKSLPNFERKTEFISLYWKNEYPWIDGDIVSSESGVIPYREYLKFVHEWVKPYSSAKRAKNVFSSYAVGPLARVNNNFKQLLDSAKETAEKLSLKTPSYNPFHSNLARIVELVHCIDDAIAKIDKLLAKGLKEEKLNVTPRAGRGVGAVEVPRGILFHDYTYNETGHISNANLVIPTNQNHENIEDDIRAWVPTLIKQKLSDEQIGFNLSMLVRSYDPCVSCSTHLIKVNFKRE
ncbi:MAG: Ni/Fe hydrogenase subunit alpha [Planctomycetota bacterium]|nr:Ni/Fe hydrogenase subunit alpha [Planctomycetota bacterium]